MQSSVTDAVRAAVSRQDSVGGLFATAEALTKSDVASLRLPSGVAEAAKHILGLRTNASQITGDQLVQAVRTSGVMSEARLVAEAMAAKGQVGASEQASALAGGSTLSGQASLSPLPITADLKLATLVLRNLLASWGSVSESEEALARTMDGRPVPPRKGAPPSAQPPGRVVLPPGVGAETIMRALFEQSEKALSRIRLSQVASLPEREDPGSTRAGAAPGQYLTTELPLLVGKDTRILHMDIERDATSPDRPNEERGVVIRFSIDLGESGPIHAHLRYAYEKLTVRVWAEQEHTALALDQHKSELAAALSAQGLAVDDMQMKPGKPAAADYVADPNVGPTHQPVDTSA